MIARENMFVPLLTADPSFAPKWQAFCEAWRDAADRPMYVALSELALHLIGKLAAQQTDAFEAVFEVVEHWLLEGDQYVRGAASVGLIEDLQNTSLHATTRPSDFEPWLRPAALHAWKRIAAFWQKVGETREGASGPAMS